MNYQLGSASNPFDSSEHIFEVSSFRYGLEPTDCCAERCSWFDKEQPACRRHRKKVCVCRHNYSTECRSTFGVHGVSRAKQSEVECIHDVHAPPPKSGYDPHIDTLVSVELERHRFAPSGLPRCLAQAAIFQLCDHGIGSGPILANRFLMIIVISERGMNVRERQMGMRAHNIFRSHSHVNNLTRDLTHLDVGPDDHRPRLRIVDVTLGAGEVTSKHEEFLALSRGADHLLGAKTAFLEANQAVSTRVSRWALARAVRDPKFGYHGGIEPAAFRWGRRTQRDARKAREVSRRANRGPVLIRGGQHFGVGACRGRE